MTLTARAIKRNGKAVEIIKSVIIKIMPLYSYLWPQELHTNTHTHT